MEGGKVIGYGGQGCIISPPLNSTDTKYVSKIVRKPDSAAEYNVARALKALDPQERYGIYVEGPLNCNVSQAKLIAEGIRPSNKASANACEQRTFEAARPGSVCAMTILKFVQSLETVPKAHTIKLLEGLRDLWLGLRFIFAKNYVHSDIKSGNIAYTRDGYMVFADWGWAYHIPTVADADFQLMRLREFPTYADPEGPWAPLVFGLHVIGDDVPKLVKFNDIFSLAKFQINFIKKMVRAKIITAASVSSVNTELNKIYKEKVSFRNTDAIIDSVLNAWNLILK